MGLSVASIFIVVGSIVPAFADAASRNIPIPNVEYTTEDWYVKENAHLIKNKDVSDKVDVNKPADKVDSVKPVADNKASQNVNNVVKRPAVANANTPKTSDSSNIALYSMLLIGSIGAISIIFRRKLRTNK